MCRMRTSVNIQGRFRQVAKISERLCAFADDVTKIVVTHHPFDVPEGHDERDLVSRAARHGGAGPLRPRPPARRPPPRRPRRPLSGDKAGRESDEWAGNKGVDLPARPAIDFSATPRRTTG